MSTVPSVPTAGPTTSPAVRLAPNAVGLAGAVFQSVSMMGPAVAVAFAFTPGIVYAGGSFPLAVGLALVGCLLLALNIGQLAAHLPSAGGFYTYVSAGLGRIPGFLTGWLMIPVYLLFVPLNLLVFGVVFAGFLQQIAGVDTPWYVWGVLLAVGMGLLTVRGVRASTRTLIVLGTLEVSVFLLLSLLLLGQAQDGNTFQAFTLAFIPKGSAGGSLTALLAGAVYAFLAFVGFESAASLAEESRHPRRTIPRAIFYSTLLIGLFFILTSYAGLAGYGFTHIFPSTPTDSHAYISDTPTPWVTLGSKVWGDAGAAVLLLMILNSAAANVGAGYTALSRGVFALVRAGTLPPWVGRLHPRYQTPYRVVALASVISIALAVWAALVYGPVPANLPNTFFLLAEVLGYCILLAYCLVSLAVPFYYRRWRRQDFSLLRHILIPAVSLVVLVGVLVAQFTVTLPPPNNYPGITPQLLAGAIVLAWVVGGGIWVLVVCKRRPSALSAEALIVPELMDTTGEM